MKGLGSRLESAGTPGHAIGNLFCATGILVCAYNFFRAITLDPGHVPAPANDSELKEVSSALLFRPERVLISSDLQMIEELVDQQSFNGMNFCLTCMVRAFLRSFEIELTTVWSRRLVDPFAQSIRLRLSGVRLALTSAFVPRGAPNL